VWMGDPPLKLGQECLIKHTTNVVRGSCADIQYRVDPDTLHRQNVRSLELNDIGRVRFTLFKPLLVDEYQCNRATGSFIVIDPVTNATLGAGMLIERQSAAEEIAALADKRVSQEITWHSGKVSGEHRRRLFGHAPVTIWLTGLSGSGKSTIAFELERRLLDAGHAAFVLDGDNVRHGLNRDLGFSPDHRKENIRRIAEVAKLMNDAGMIVITAFISPYREDRTIARAIIGSDRFIETYLAADLTTCERRDPKGLYAKARAGAIAEFTGVSAPYEVPENAELRLESGARSVDEVVGQVFDAVAKRFR